MRKRKLTSDDAWGHTMDNFTKFPSGFVLGKRIHGAMEHLADVVLNPRRRWKNYAEHTVAIRDALGEVEVAARAAKFAIETAMKNFGLRTSKKEIEGIGKKKSRRRS